MAIEEKFQTKDKGEIEKDNPIDCAKKVHITVYKGKAKTRGILKWIPFIEIYGETAVHKTGMLIIILAYCLLPFMLLFLIRGFSKDWMAFIAIFLYFIFSLLCIHGEWILSYEKYVKSTKCKKCHRKYAYEECDEPDIKEVTTENSYTVTTTRYWRCKHCGYIDSSESSENILASKGKREKPKKIKCEKCRKIGLSPECRSPDVKTENLLAAIFTTTRYYRCDYCGHVNIKVKMEESSTFDLPLAR